MALLSGCRLCRRHIFRLLTSLEPLTSAPSIVLPSQRLSSANASKQGQRHRAFSSYHQLRNTQGTEPDQQPEQGSPAEDATPGNLSIASDPAIPWYLQVQPPTPPASSSIIPHLAAQELPPLPSDPPPILESMLKHLSISIGLDNLSLLDLRELTPPSALGANLIMILGTARSTKHLNTSADRFCRWLRSTYNLRPYADGLLGRNELKLKLRRKNRKIKLAQTVGNTIAMQSSGGYDDGIGTGWICCNVGIVEGVEANEDLGETSILHYKDQERILDDEEKEYLNPPVEQPEEFRYAGFGNSQFAPRIVVQMFTEEKREEMDLEGLWDARIVRRAEKEDRREEQFEHQQGSVPGRQEIEGVLQSIEAEQNSVRKEQRDQSLLKDLGPISSAGAAVG